MPAPTVACVCLTRDRPEMAARALECFRSQTYPKEYRLLVLYDTSESSFLIGNSLNAFTQYTWEPTCRGLTIGALRNRAQDLHDADIVVHFDDDDWSHPERVAEQVSLLQSSGADCVAYNEVPFWSVPEKCDCILGSLSSGSLHDSGCAKLMYPGETWLYRDRRPTLGIGASLCYRRSAWARCKFTDAPKSSAATSEYYRFLTYSRTVACSSLIAIPSYRSATGVTACVAGAPSHPRLICRIHRGNSSDYSNLWTPGVTQNAFKKSPELADICRKVFE